MSDFQNTKVTTARKARICPECRTEIALGQKYAKESGCYDGDFYNAVMCLPCKAFVDRYVQSMQLCSALNWDECTYTFGDIINEAAEFVDYKAEPRQPYAQTRDAIMALFDEWDAGERAEQARERENAKRAKAFAARHHQNVIASLRMIRGMSQCSATRQEAA